MNNAPFRVGQRVVALRDSIFGHFEKNETYIVKSLCECKCGCGRTRVCIGSRVKAAIAECSNTRKPVAVRGELAYHGLRNFAPIPPRSIEIPESLKEQAEEMKDLAETIAPMKKELV